MMVCGSEKLDSKRGATAAPATAFAGQQEPAVRVPVPAAELADNVQFLSDQLAAVRRDHAKLQQAVFEAAQIQRQLCAPRELTRDDLEIAGEIFPVRNLSGDFFKVFEIGSALAVALGDIAGKGMTAGIWQTHILGAIRRNARLYTDPASVLAAVNQELCLDLEGPPLTALFFAHIDPATATLTYCNAGLPAPLLLRANKTLERLDHGGPMLGAVQLSGFECGSVTLNPGDMLVAYSDGVTECRNRQDEEFETDRLIAAATAVAGATANKALFSLLGTVLDFAGSCSPGDDVTLLVVRRSARAAESPRPKDFATLPRRSSGAKPRNSGRGGRSSRN